MLKNSKQLPNLLVLAMVCLALLGGIYGINSFKKLAVCSPFFVSSLAITLLLAEKFDLKVAWGAILLCLTLNLALYWQSLQWMHIFSFMGILSAVYGSTHLFSALKSLTSLPGRVFASLSCGVLIDAIAMLPWELYMFTSPRFWDVVFRSVSYKLSYVSLVSLGLLLICSRNNKRQGKYKTASTTH